MLNEGSAPRVAVVDDNPITRYSTSRVLRGAGFDVGEGATGQQALELAFNADILLLDVNLPDIHGLEVCRRLRNDPQTARLPIVHVSATFINESDKVKGLDSGGDGYLTHPVEPRVLIATVRAFLRARRAEDEMRLSEAKFRAIFDNARSGILLLDQSLNYLEVNPAMCEMLKRDREQILGAHLSSFAPAGTFDPRDIARDFADRGSWQGVFPLLRSDGRLVYFEWSISEYSMPGVLLAVVIDITARIQLEEERNQLLDSERVARTEAERASRSKDEFLATLSHELRTPLNSILLWTQTLQHHTREPEEVARGLAAIERNTKVQAQLIADLLDVSRIISGKLHLDVQPMDLAATIRAALEGLMPAIAKKRLKLVTSLDDSVSTVSGDSARVQQVVSNLVINAIKFTPEGGTIEVLLRYENNHATITVNDTGQGIAPELLPHLFERFRQGDFKAREANRGLGLGLAIVKHTVEMHGGVVTASSEGPGKGATFVVSLPIDGVQSCDDINRQDASVEALRLSGLRIMVVEDDEQTCAMMFRVLKEYGAVVATAGSVEDALEQLISFDPQVLISDIGIPGKDGYQLIREVRTQGVSMKRLPAIALTAFARFEDEQQALRAGYQLYLTKPIDVAKLIDAIVAVAPESLTA
jgi:PAS domain S-box-containing protein